MIGDVQRKEDAADYTCVARNDEGYSARSDLKVTVMGKKKCAFVWSLGGPFRQNYGFGFLYYLHFFSLEKDEVQKKTQSQWQNVFVENFSHLELFNQEKVLTAFMTILLD